MAKAVDDPGTAVAAIGNSIEVLKLKNGHLSRHYIFSRPHSRIACRPHDILLVHEWFFYVQNGDRYSNMIEVYNTLNGELVQTIYLSAHAIGASTNGREILFGFKILAII